jgi:ATP-dependent helicase HrpA
MKSDQKTIECSDISRNISPQSGMLPVLRKQNEIISAIKTNQVIIVAGETGSGKTTQLPLMCLKARPESKGKIVCTQPRRIAAVSLAKYVSRQISQHQDNFVGYRIRFQEKMNPSTRIAFVTDGILLSEIQTDPLLSHYDTVIIDEAHERTLNIDFLLGYLRLLLNKRKDLKLIISSATIDTGLFSRCFWNAPVINVSERLYNVEIRYKPVIALWDGSSMRSHIDGTIHIVKEIVDSGENGDLLVFLPTIDDIHEVVSVISAFSKNSDDLIMPLHSRISPDQQELIFAPCKGRRIIIATNIAETSITVPGIRFVIDSGLARIVRYDPNAGINRMPVERISKASADQRAGRCGRVSDGVCIRLYSEQDYYSRPKFTFPEIKRANLSGVILRMARLKVGKPESFPFLQRPSAAALTSAYHRLKELGAIDKKGMITKLGFRMASLPLDPAISRMLLFARKQGGFAEMAVIAAALSVGDPRTHNSNATDTKTTRRISASDPDSDFIAFVNIWKKLHRYEKKESETILPDNCDRLGLSLQKVREWIDVHNQLLRIIRIRLGAEPKSHQAASYETIHKNLLIAFWNNIAERQSDSLYHGLNKNNIMISPGSILFKKEYPLVLFHDIVETNRLYGRTAAAIKPEWLRDLFPEKCRTTYENPFFDPESGSVLAFCEISFEGLPLVKNKIVDYSRLFPSKAHEVFVNEALVEEKIAVNYNFIKANRDTIADIDLSERKLRDRSYFVGSHALEEFYSERLSNVSTVQELNEKIRSFHGDGFLYVKQEELLSKPFPEELRLYPDSIVMGDTRLPLTYVFDPGKENDGVTVKVQLTTYRSIPRYYWEWLLPVFFKKRLDHFLQSAGIVFSENDFESILSKISIVPRSFIKALIETAKNVIAIPDDSIKAAFVSPTHLWLKIDITDEKGIILDSIRPPREYGHIKPHPDLMNSFWSRWFDKLETTSFRKWDFDQPVQTAIIQSANQQFPLAVFKSLTPCSDGVAFKIYFSETDAVRECRNAIKTLLELYLEEDIAWASKDIKIAESLLIQTRSIMDPVILENTVELLLREIILEIPFENFPTSKESFTKVLNNARMRLQSAPAEAVCLIDTVSSAYKSCMELLSRFSSRYACRNATTAAKLENDLQSYLEIIKAPENRLSFIRQLPRILNAFRFRIESAYLSFDRFSRIEKEIEMIRYAFNPIKSSYYAAHPSLKQQIEYYEIMIEDYAAALYANGNVSRSSPVSTKALEVKYSEIVKIYDKLIQI